MMFRAVQYLQSTRYKVHEPQVIIAGYKVREHTFMQAQPGTLVPHPY